VDFEVSRNDLHETRVVESDPPEIGRGQLLLGVDSFGLTTNNITYALMGDTMSYWDFFPAEDGWGRVPMWGFADVVESEAEGIEEGTRVFGYLPPSSHLVVRPDRASPSDFVDASPHRSKLPSAYNRYARVTGDPLYEEETEDHQMLLWPLYFTSFMIDDFLGDEGLFGAKSAVLSSASSRTSSSLAWLLARRDGVEVIGLTSPRNVEFVESLGVYDTVATYDQIATLNADPAVYVDMAGDAKVRSAVHEHFGESLAHSASVGITHREELGGVRELPGPKPTFFFAPDRLRKRAKDWGPEELNTRVADAWRPYVEWTRGWLEVVHEGGPEAIERIYLEMLDGKSDPAVGHVLSPAPG
jgi:hypothetical protein